MTSGRGAGSRGLPDPGGGSSHPGDISAPPAPATPGGPPDPILSVRPAGDRGHLVEVTDNRQVHALAAAVRDRFGGAVADVVPGEDTLLLCWKGRPPSLAAVAIEIRGLALIPPVDRGLPHQATTIPVRYDGADLDAVAGALDLRVERVIELHSQPEYLVAFVGFAPGFAYLTGGSPQLQLPRRDEPRRRVPAGSVAIASTYSAVYPRSAPGGWHLLGHTDAVLFDPDREPPALLEAGMRVVFDPQTSAARPA